ncbi:MAG TPA: hypothetical protein VGB55_11585, partial [Tepidisphaeraceae bacterium]
GIIETATESGEQFSQARLEAAYLASPDDARGAINAVVGAVAQHRGDFDPEDDLTLVSLRMLPVAMPTSAQPASYAI